MLYTLMFQMFRSRRQLDIPHLFLFQNSHWCNQTFKHWLSNLLLVGQDQHTTQTMVHLLHCITITLPCIQRFNIKATILRFQLSTIIVFVMNFTETPQTWIFGSPIIVSIQLTSHTWHISHSLLINQQWCQAWHRISGTHWSVMVHHHLRPTQYHMVGDYLHQTFLASCRSISSQHTMEQWHLVNHQCQHLYLKLQQISSGHLLKAVQMNHHALVSLLIIVIRYYVI